MMHAALFLLLPLLLIGAAPPLVEREEEREKMVLEIDSLAATVGRVGAGRIDRKVLAAMRNVPRHMFVPKSLAADAYKGIPLPIGHGATISQPYIVALMTDLAGVGSGDVVLEVGTGSGYQAAILAELGVKVFSIEIVEPLAKSAAERLARLGYDDVIVRNGDGYAGWPEHAPYDAIIVTAAAPHVPQPLVNQLRPGGRLVVPVTEQPGEEQLMLVTKGKSGEVRRRSVMPVRFVPLVHDEPGS